MKILFVCENYLPHYGGAEVVFKNLAEGMVKAGHEVNLITRRLKGTKRDEVINGVRVHRVRCFDSRYLFSFFSVPKVWKLAKDADVIQTTTFNGAPPAWLGGKLRHKPVVITVHEVWVNKWDKVTDLGKLSSFIHNAMEKMIYKLKYDQYVCVSEATTKDLKNIGVEEKRIKRIYNGFDYAFWNPKQFDGEAVRKKYGFEDKFVYFSWGRPGTSKGFEYAIKAVPKIVEKIPNSVFLLSLGSVDQYKKRYNLLLELVKKLKVEDKVKIILSLPYAELGNYIKAADCVIVPSIAEGFGYTTLEAGAMGNPVVASNTGSIPEVIGGKYLLFTPKNHHELAEKVIEAHSGEIKTHPVKKFTWEEAIKGYLGVYEGLVNGKRGVKSNTN